MAAFYEKNDHEPSEDFVGAAANNTGAGHYSQADAAKADHIMSLETGMSRTAALTAMEPEASLFFDLLIRWRYYPSFIHVSSRLCSRGG